MVFIRKPRDCLSKGRGSSRKVFDVVVDAVPAGRFGDEVSGRSPSRLEPDAGLADVNLIPRSLRAFEPGPVAFVRVDAHQVEGHVVFCEASDTWASGWPLWSPDRSRAGSPS